MAINATAATGASQGTTTATAARRGRAWPQRRTMPSTCVSVSFVPCRGEATSVWPNGLPSNHESALAAGSRASSAAWSASASDLIGSRCVGSVVKTHCEGPHCTASKINGCPAPESCSLRLHCLNSKLFGWRSSSAWASRGPPGMFMIHCSPRRTSWAYTARSLARKARSRANSDPSANNDVVKGSCPAAAACMIAVLIRAQSAV